MSLSFELTSIHETRSTVTISTVITEYWCWKKRIEEEHSPELELSRQSQATPRKCMSKSASYSKRTTYSSETTASRIEELAHPTLPNYQNNLSSLSFDKTRLSQFTEVKNFYFSKMHNAHISMFEKEIKLLDKLLARNSDDFRSLSKKGVALTYLEMYITAIEHFDKALKVKPDDCYSMDGKGFVLIILKQYTEAIKCFERVLKLQPDNPNALYHMGDALKATGNMEEAKKYCEKAVQVKPDIYVELVNYANALLCQGYFKQAVKWYNKALEIKPGNEEALRNMSIANEELQNRTMPSIDVVETSSRLVELAIPKRNFAQLNRDVVVLFNPPQPKLDSHITISARLKELALPRRVVSKSAKNESAGMKQTANRAISARLERLSTPKSNYGALNKDVLAYLNFERTASQSASQYISVLEKYEGKLDMYNKMLQANPNNYEILNEKGNVLRNLGRFNEAIEIYDKGLEIKPDDHHSLDSKGFTLLIVYRYTEAVECFGKALKIRPDYPQALYHMSDVLKATGKTEEAKAYYEKAVEHKEDIYVDLLGFANSVFARKQYEEAIRWYDKVLDLKPDHDEAVKNKNKAQQEYNKKIEKIIHIFRPTEKISSNQPVKATFIKSTSDDATKLGDTSKTEGAQTSSKSFDVFISYSWKQKKQVKNLFKILTKSGINCWMDDNQLKPGDKLFRQLADAIYNSKLVIFCISNDYLNSVNCQREFDYTFMLKKKYIPVILCKDKKKEFGEWPCHHSVFFTMGDVIYVAKLFDQLDKSEEESLLIENTPLVDFVEQVKAAVNPDL